VNPKRVVVIGDVMLDVSVQPTRNVAPTSDTPSNVSLGRGGSGANVAVALAHYGHEVIYVGVVGNDFAGQLFADELVQSGVTPQLIAGAGPTGVVVSLVAPDGQRAMMTDRGVNDQLTVDHVATVLEEPLDHLHLSGYTLLDDVTRPIGTAALDMARSKGATTSVDVCSVGPLAQVGVPVFLEAAMPISMLFANGEEAMLLTGERDARTAAIELSPSFDEVLVTLGREGALAAKAGTLHHEASHSVDVLDTTGAGDAASGAYLANRLSGASIDDSLVAAMDAAAVVVRGLGSRG
jgi:sugar/nucleoside kinase (ribokinase family)